MRKNQSILSSSEFIVLMHVGTPEKLYESFLIIFISLF